MGVEMNYEIGEVIKVDRGFYFHFGIYSGDNKVIHYTVEEGNELSKMNAKVTETSLEKFMNKDTALYKVIFPEEYGKTISIGANLNFSSILGGELILKELLRMIQKLMRKYKYHKYTKKETLERAKSKLGKGEYNLIYNNCEHFVWWCKTGIERSEQIEELKKGFEKIQKKKELDGILYPIKVSIPFFGKEPVESLKEVAIDCIFGKGLGSIIKRW
jgi:hypothetical protein